MDRIEQHTDEAALAEHNVTACFPDMEAARQAIESLERAGVPGSHISLLGPQAEEAADVTDTSQADAQLGEKAVRATLGGAATGAGVGGAVGFLAGAVAFGIPGVGPGELTLHEVSDGYVVVGAHTDDADEFDGAIEALRRHDPRKLHRFDAEGNEVPA